ncbi:MAG: right-handed parallel beta-helix repeat-containing protein, partial [Candidatus Electryonea clarkiae]|nr:right-handed parallel beta-helix repeat-containing protein [Candidatus Electryonea clarkiae]
MRFQRKAVLIIIGFLYLILGFGQMLFADITGTVMLCDSSWNDIVRVTYPFNSSQIYVEVRDPDRNLDPRGLDTLGVVFTSESEQDFEYVILEEEPHLRNSGIFRGSIEVDAETFMFARPTEEEVSLELIRLREGFTSIEENIPPAMKEKWIQGEAYANVIRRLHESTPPPPRVRYLELDEEGILEIFSGEMVVCSYTDPENYWGNEVIIADSAIFGGYSGDVSGQTWTVENSPYLITGHVYTTTSGLTIEAGVHVQFTGNYSFSDANSPQIIGAVGDSVYFEGHEMYRSRGVAWSWTFSFSGDDGIIDKAVFVDNFYVLTSSGMLTTNSRFTNTFGNIGFSCTISNCVFTDNYRSLDMYGVSLSGCTFTENEIYGIRALRNSEVSNCVLDNNVLYGMYCFQSTYDTIRIDNSSFIGNGLNGICVNTSFSRYTIQNCEIYNSQGNFDVYNATLMDMDMRFNDWGETTTAEMNRGDNPQDISRILDRYNLEWLGFVDYAGYVGRDYEGITASVMLTDSEWNDIGNKYPIDTEEIFVEIWDPDRNIDENNEDTLGVIFSSDSEQDFEYIILTETLDNSDIFHGSIPLDTDIFMFARPGEEDIANEVSRLRIEKPFLAEEYLEAEAFQNVQKKLIDSSLITPLARTFELDEEGILEIYEGETAVCTYLDHLNNWDEEEEVVDGALVGGGLSGDVSGQVWTVENSPYDLVGDIYSSNNDWDERLTIEAGVHVRYTGNFLFGGMVEMNGEENDSIYVGAHPQISTDLQYFWSALAGDEVINHTVFQGTNPYQGFTVVLMRYAGMDSLFVSNCRFSDLEQISIDGKLSNSLIDGCFKVGGLNLTNCIVSRGKYYGVGLLNGNLLDCTISGSRYSGVYSFASKVSGCDIFENGEHGVHMVTQAPDLVNCETIDCRIYDNSLHGIFVAGEPGVNIKINNCELYNNESGIDVCNDMSQDVDASYNYWGEETTEEMNDGDNPQDIGAIWDNYDDNRMGFVNYAHYVGSDFEGHSSFITLTNGAWEDIGFAYPFETDNIYVEVQDIDRNGNPGLIDTLGVVFSSESEEDFEYLILEETGTNSGIFHGSIEVDAETFMFAHPTEPEIEKELVRLRNELYKESLKPSSDDNLYSTNPFLVADGSAENNSSVKKTQECDVIEKMLRQKAYSKVMQRIVESSQDIKRQNELDELGVLEIFDGEKVTCTYIDQLNDWDEEEEISDSAFFGGISGYVDDQIWTVENSPYIIVGGVFTMYGTLTIEAGVHVQFAGSFSIQSYGGLVVEGELEDSVYFEAHEAVENDPLNSLWSVYANSGNGDTEINFAVFQGGNMIRFDNQASVTNCSVSGSGWVEFSNNSSVSNCVFSDNEGGVSLRDSDMSACVITGNAGGFGGSGNCNVDSCIIAENGAGVGIGVYDHTSQFTINSCSIIDNWDNGIMLAGIQTDRIAVVIRNSELYDNVGYDIYNGFPQDILYTSPKHIDARYNWWGEATTLEMEDGDNPKNISRIYDNYDYEWSGDVYYSDYLLEPPASPPDHYFQPVEGEETYSIVVTVAMIDDVPLVAGDEIGVFDYYPDEDGELVCVGAAIIEEEHDWEEDNITVHAIRRFDEDDI